MATKLPKVAPPKKQTTPMRMRALRCDDQTWDAAKARAEHDGIDLSEVVRHYLREYASGHRKK